MLVLGATYFIVYQKNIENAEQTIRKDLEVTAEAFQELLAVRTQGLFDIVRPATSDFAFIKAFKTKHNPTLVSAMQNLTERIYNLRTDLMILVDLEGELIATTKNGVAKSAWADLIKVAENDEFSESSGIRLISNEAYQIIVTPLFTPDPEAWIVIGFPIDKTFAQDTREITQRDISVVQQDKNQHILLASSLQKAAEQNLQEFLSEPKSKSMFQPGSHIIELGDEKLVSLAQPLQSRNSSSGLSEFNEPLCILLQGSLDQALAPYQRLNRALINLFVLALFFALLATLWLSRSISKPLQKLSKNVSLIDQGDYSVRTNLERQDELSTLGESINRMAKGLEEKEQVRSLLGKVVSDDIANELLSKELELGGEEKEVTILFSDVRNFTAMCEGASPSAILERLNRYFNLVSKEIEQQGGVVDKYIGDAIMALYGAPVYYENAAERAINSALGMFVALEEINQAFEQEGVARLGMGIGISTGKVVVGNMGSENRLNYTAIGDDVNLASRLEGLTKMYGVPIIVSRGTMKQAQQYVYRFVDKVRVKGKQNPVSIYTPLGLDTDSVVVAQKEKIEIYNKGIVAYQTLCWDPAISHFEAVLQLDEQDTLARLYLKRCQSYKVKPPQENWNGVHVLDMK